MLLILKMAINALSSSRSPEADWMTNLLPVHVTNPGRRNECLARFQKWNEHLRNVACVPAVDGTANRPAWMLVDSDHFRLKCSLLRQKTCYIPSVYSDIPFLRKVRARP